MKLILKDGVQAPKYMSSGASGMDVVANSILKVFKGDTEVTGERLERIKQGFIERGYVKLRPFERILFGTGVILAHLGQDREIQVRDRSSVALKKGLLVANSPGTVDSDYRGEIGVILYNSSPFLNTVQKDDRIAQIVVNFVEKVVPTIVIKVIDETVRGEEGYGSTNNKESL